MNQIAVIPDNRIAVRQGMDELIARFISSLDVRENTKREYGKQLKQFLTWIQAEGITEPSREDLLHYKEQLKARKLSANTVKAHLTAIRVFFTWAESVKFYPNVSKGIKGGRQAQGFRKEPLTLEQARELLTSIHRDTLEGKRDYAFLNLLIRTGLRTIELIRADVQDISQASGEATLAVWGKNRDEKDAIVVLTEQTLKPLQEYLQARGAREEEPLFTSLSDRNKGGRLSTRSIRRLAKEHLRGIGLDNEKLTAHSLRHTAITLALKAGATLQEAKELARHSNLNTVLIYSHNIDRIKQAPERKIDALLATV